MEVTNTIYHHALYVDNALFIKIDVQNRLGTVIIFHNCIRGSKFHDEEVELPIKFEWCPSRRKVIPILDRKNIQDNILRTLDYQERELCHV